MSESLAAELLADFDDDENEERTSDTEADSSGLFSQGRSKSEDFGMEIDDDDEDGEGDDGDSAMGGVGTDALDKFDDAEARLLKVEKMQLGAVDDVRSVAGLMKVLEPVLEVHFSSPPSYVYG